MLMNVNKGLKTLTLTPRSCFPSLSADKPSKYSLSLSLSLPSPQLRLSLRLCLTAARPSPESCLPACISTTVSARDPPRLF